MWSLFIVFMKRDRTIQGLCVKCKMSLQTSDGYGKYKLLCTGCHKGKEYKVYKKSTCDHCGFVPLHSCQLDVDHIDGDHTNNNPPNLQTLCANCHRLKTFLHKDWH